MQCSVSSTASRLKRLAAIPEGIISGFFLTCLFGGCDSCNFCDFGGSGSGLEGAAVCECDSAGGGSELCLTGWCTGGGGGGGDMLLDLTGAGGQLVRWCSIGGDLEEDNHGRIYIEDHPKRTSALRVREVNSKAYLVSKVA